MSNSEDLLAKRDVLTAMPDDQMESPHSIPVSIYVQEADNLHYWCQADRAGLEALGLEWALVEDLPVRCGALREAQSQWSAERYTRETASKQWVAESPEAFKLWKRLTQDFRFAFDGHPVLLGRVKDISERSTNAGKLQGLNDLKVLGQANGDLLTAVGFDMTLLDTAGQKSEALTEVLAAATGESANDSEARILRDKAYTHVKEVVDKIYRYGKYLSRDDESRTMGYRSAYLRKMRNRRAARAVASDGDGITDLSTPLENAA